MKVNGNHGKSITIHGKSMKILRKSMKTRNLLILPLLPLLPILSFLSIFPILPIRSSARPDRHTLMSRSAEAPVTL